LFKDVTTVVPVPGFGSRAEVLATFKAVAASSPTVDKHVEKMKADAARASTDPRLARGAEYAATINLELRDMQAARAAGDIKGALFHMDIAVQTWTMLRADANFGRAVRSRERSEANVGRRTNVTPAQAADAVQKHEGNKTLAAENLGISRPTLDKLLLG